MVFMLPVWVMPHSLGLACGYAILEGEAEERLIGWTETGFMALEGALYLSNVSPRAHGLNIAATAVELGVVLSVALRSNKLWPMVYASAVLVALMTMVAAAVLEANWWARGTANFVWNYLEIVTLVSGTWCAARDRRRAAARSSPVMG